MGSARSALAGVVLAFAVVLGCGRSDGEGWAKKRLGEQAEVLRAEAGTKSGRSNPDRAPDVTSPAKALPRPYVVFEVVADKDRPGHSKLVYAVMNEDRGFDFPATAPRAFVVLNDEVMLVGKKRNTKAVGSVQITIVDRASGKVAHADAPRMDAVRGVLDALPDK